MFVINIKLIIDFKFDVNEVNKLLKKRVEAKCLEVVKMKTMRSVVLIE